MMNLFLSSLADISPLLPSELLTICCAEEPRVQGNAEIPKCDFEVFLRMTIPKVNFADCRACLVQPLTSSSRSLTPPILNLKCVDTPKLTLTCSYQSRLGKGCQPIENKQNIQHLTQNQADLIPCLYLHVKFRKTQKSLLFLFLNPS